LSMYVFEISPEEMEVIKQLAQRWLIELQDAYNNIDEIFPFNMRDAIREDMKEQIDQAEHICEELGCLVNN
jgi:hypothetical protein